MSSLLSRAKADSCSPTALPRGAYPLRPAACKGESSKSSIATRRLPAVLADGASPEDASERSLAEVAASMRAPAPVSPALPGDPGGSGGGSRLRPPAPACQERGSARRRHELSHCSARSGRPALTFRHVFVDGPLHLGEAPLEVVAAAASCHPCGERRGEEGAEGGVPGPAPPPPAPALGPGPGGRGVRAPHLPCRAVPVGRGQGAAGPARGRRRPGPGQNRRRRTPLQPPEVSGFQNGAHCRSA